MSRVLFVTMPVALIASISLGQELLTNPSFTNPPVAASCAEDWQDIEGWSMTPQASPNGSGERRNGDYKQPTCPRAGDGTHASLQGWGVESKRAYQTVTGLTAAQTYQFSGVWWFGHDLFWPWGKLIVTAELRDGPDPDTSPLIQKVERQFSANGTTGAWLPFAVCGAPTGSTLTVVFRGNNQDAQGYALHVDDCHLVAVPSCPTEPNAIDGINPSFAPRGALINDAIIVGSGFRKPDLTANVTAVTLSRAGQPDIVATDLKMPSANTLTCDFNLAGAANGRWNVVVTFASGTPLQDTLPGGFLIVLPSVSNGSFELPTAAGGCPVTPIPGRPTDWLVSALGTWDDSQTRVETLYRDSDHARPTCPPPDLLHYGSTYSIPDNPNAQPEVHIYQTIAVDRTKQYVASGYLAGAGDNAASLELLQGDETGPIGSSFTAHRGGAAPYDWTYAVVPIQPTGDLLTVRWRVTTRSPGPHTSHADKIALDKCSGSVGLTEIVPAEGENNGSTTVTITGSGFEGSPMPTLMLTKSGELPVYASGVSVLGDTALSCSFDLTGRAIGSWDLTIVKGGCFAKLEAGFAVTPYVAPAFANGDFELSNAGPVNCGTPVPGVPQSWYGDISGGTFNRDSDVHRPPTCPSPAGQGGGGHYGSLTKDGTGFLYAYQIIRVTPGVEYELKGFFSGAGQNDVYIALIDGKDYFALPLAYTQVRAHGGSADPMEQYDWTAASVKAAAVSDIMAVVWWMDIWGDETPNASHADGLTFGSPCNTPRQDVTGDGSVDLIDFTVFSSCFNGPNRPYGVQDPPDVVQKCRCLDTNDDGSLDLMDFSAFATCFNGPNRPPACP